MKHQCIVAVLDILHDMVVVVGCCSVGTLQANHGLITAGGHQVHMYVLVYLPLNVGTSMRCLNTTGQAVLPSGSIRTNVEFFSSSVTLDCSDTYLFTLHVRWNISYCNLLALCRAICIHYPPEHSLQVAIEMTRNLFTLPIAHYKHNRA